MNYTNDPKPSGSYTDDTNSFNAAYGTAIYGTSRYGMAGSYIYSNDSKPSGSYVNDTKPT